MAKKDLFGDEVSIGPSDDFATMFELSSRGQLKNLRQGDHLKGEILSMSKEFAFVSTGTPNDGQIPTVELLDADKKLKFKVGDIIDVVVVRIKGDEIILRYRDAKGASSDVDNLEDAFDMELPVEGRVLEAVKGGYRIQIHGQKAFCPVSQIDMRPSADANDYINQKYNFLITQYENNGRNIVVSRKKILQIEKAEFEGTFLQKHKIGDILTGTVKKMEKFGAFIELEGGIEGLVHISEIAWGRISDPAEVLRLGQSVSVKLLKVEEEETRLKISLSIKQGGGDSDPWLSISQKYPVGSIHEGLIERKEVYGLFVQIAPGLTGLLPKSKWKDHVEGHDYDLKKKGDHAKVQIDQILTEERKISLTLPSDANDESWKSFQKPSQGSGSGLGSGLGSLADLMKTKK